MRILDAAIASVREKGYAATRVDEVATAAGVTKGGFFHHFKNKEEMAVAAAARWSEVTGQLFEAAPYHLPDDPLDRVLAYIDFRREIIGGQTDEFTCYVGTLAQEVHLSAPAIREAARASIFAHAETYEVDIDAAKAEHCPDADWSAESLALHIQAVLQGAFIIAKADGGPDRARESVDHLKRYVELLFEKDDRR
ncbi:TetR/AcrR family transcriptional regulator [Notoacmeibacter sp. MSK16QG-6]|uniref:TetR/AcrR family transcriptional regulator n=1 Tax=Notoacmeibacter sp. MSK16QG-6 TaxID=2957982 RepID=UPI0020A2110D|nr:TetR/AcrR family transcriptional regulator [Notoacmeibacter sp. MSK16QG-6]MCP1198835.1 TetR/AcrR family transcriptional regulator [Notoacmeibacter sp. MSK16QG-6]